MALDPITAGLDLAKGLVNRFWPDAGESEKREMEIYVQSFVARAGIIQTEAASSHWLAANWRPLLMLTFGGMIVARFMGWTAPNVSEMEYIALWDLMKLGIGGYIGGRTIEKIGPGLIDAIKGRQK